MSVSSILPDEREPPVLGLKLSGMPQLKRLEDFGLSWLKGGMPQNRSEELATLAFIERKENVIFLGPSGVGKTHLMLALGHKACVSGYTAYYISCRDAIEKLLKAREQNRLRKTLAWFRKPHVLFSTKSATSLSRLSRPMSSSSSSTRATRSPRSS